MGTRTRRTWQLDNQGKYARQIGWKRTRSGSLAQHKFRFGSDIKEAEARDQQLQSFWKAIERETRSGRATWDEFTLDVAKRIAAGDVPVGIERGPGEPTIEYARRVRALQKRYPVVSFAPKDEAAYAQGLQEDQLARRQPFKVELPADRILRDAPTVAFAAWPTNVNSDGECGAPRTSADQTRRVPDNLPAAGSGQTLHQAMQGYVAWLEKEFYEHDTGDVSEWGRAQQRQVQTLMDRHSDRPLDQIDLEAVEELVRFWRRRPMNIESTKPLAHKTCQNQISLLTRFLTWLHRRPEYGWSKPSGFAEIDRRVNRIPEEQQGRLTQVATYSLDELILLNKYATPIERVFLLLGLNCAFGMKEIATLLVSEAVLFKAHDPRLQELLNFRSTNADSFIKRVRRKSVVYAEFLLFRQTVEMLQWALERRAKYPDMEPNARLLLNDMGEPYDKRTKSGNRNQQIPNRFAALIQRIRDDDHKDFPKLSFGKIRKTASDFVRQRFGGELASVFLSHGTPVAGDSLAEVYTNRPFGRLFEALRRYEEYLQPMFAAAGPNPTKPGPQAYTKRSSVDRILEMHKGGASVARLLTPWENLEVPSIGTFNEFGQIELHPLDGLLGTSFLRKPAG